MGKGDRAVRVTAPLEDGDAVRTPRVFSWPVKIALMGVLVAAIAGIRWEWGRREAAELERVVGELRARGEAIEIAHGAAVVDEGGRRFEGLLRELRTTAAYETADMGDDL